MFDYLTLKLIHILSSVVMVGTGFGTAFYLFFANRSSSVESISVVSKLVVKADTWFTTPAVILQPITGILMMRMAGWDMSTTWLQLAISLYVFAGLLWLPVVWIQLKLRDMAEESHSNKTELPKKYWKYAKIWELMGYPAFIAMLGIYYLMVFKPTF